MIFNSSMTSKFILAAACAAAAAVGYSSAFGGEEKPADDKKPTVPAHVAAAVKAWECPIVFDAHNIARHNCEKNAPKGAIKTEDYETVIARDSKINDGNKVYYSHVKRNMTFVKGEDVYLHDHDLYAKREEVPTYWGLSSKPVDTVKDKGKGVFVPPTEEKTK